MGFRVILSVFPRVSYSHGAAYTFFCFRARSRRSFKCPSISSRADCPSIVLSSFVNYTSRHRAPLFSHSTNSSSSSCVTSAALPSFVACLIGAFESVIKSSSALPFVVTGPSNAHAPKLSPTLSLRPHRLLDLDFFGPPDPQSRIRCPFSFLSTPFPVDSYSAVRMLFFFFVDHVLISCFCWCNAAYMFCDCLQVIRRRTFYRTVDCFI